MSHRVAHWLKFSPICLLVILFAGSSVAADSAKPTLDTFGWLAGHWRLQSGDRITEEQWMAPAGGLMVGMSRTVKAGKALEYEFTLIRHEPNGEIVFVASPSKQTETTFRLASFTANEAVFENSTHDFPKKVAYSRQPDGSLLAYIEGPGRDGRLRRIDFHYQRVTASD